MRLRFLSLPLCIGMLAACASVPTPDVRRTPAPAAASGEAQTVPLAEAEPPRSGPQAQIRRGSGQMINRGAASAPPPSLRGASSGAATFNFEGESVHAVVKAILGDMLGQNYVIAPGVQGTVTLGTPNPVSPAEALSLLEMVLGWNNARLIYTGGRYNIVPADQALAGTVAPRTGDAAGARGHEVRVVPLRFISASEMKKVLEPYARPNAIVAVDASRNVITLAGSRSELENYLRTVEIFDVDWLSNMSVGVFPLQSGRATKVVADLEKVFGQDSKTPSAGMFRFLPLEGANAVLVITPQPAYLDQIQQWLERIDSAGEGSRLFSYELKYIKAKELAQRLAEVFGAGASGEGRATGGPGNVSLMPGTDPVQINDAGVDGRDGSVGFGGSSGSGGGLGSGSLSLNQRDNGNAAVTLEVEGSRVGVSAVEETNTLLVRASASAWQSIREVVEKLDVMPMQVHIEAQVAEVTLTGDLSYGVNWYFERAVTDVGLPSAEGRTTWSGLAGNITGTGSANNAIGPGFSWTFLGRNAAAIITALDEVTDVRLLQTPSVFVRNNAEATLNVGSRIPISSVTVNPGLGGDSTYSQVQYLDTGIILKVRPRVTRDGMVFLDIVQEVSTPGDIPDDNGNVRINTRRLKTEAAVQAGNTVMLAGLISDGANKGSRGMPGLSRLPVIGGLFGRQTSRSERSEVIVLLTPTIVRNPQEANALTDEYGQRFRALEPLHAPKKK
ncbi:type II secretion system secretin GspD [Pseudoxanthomonas mexicana]|uniref:type II secretion system secretin GspD n=1 Tax=Pseudoxanthomonas mexicana TaxID=128785 RepID=UPI00398AE320